MPMKCCGCGRAIRATANLLWNQRVAMVRACAKQRKFAMARQEWESLAQHLPSDADSYWLDLLRAAIEYKANNVEEADRYVAAAEAKAAGPDAGLDDHAHARRPVRA